MNCSVVSGQICTICLDEDHKVGKFEKVSPDSESPIEITEGKILCCGHAFHEICINRFLYNNTRCPNCRAEVSKSDRLFDLIKDPAPPSDLLPSPNDQRYLSVDEEETIAIILPGNISETDKKIYLKAIHDFLKEKEEPT